MGKGEADTASGLDRALILRLRLRPCLGELPLRQESFHGEGLVQYGPGVQLGLRI